jgi:hypothetical protein
MAHINLSECRDLWNTERSLGGHHRHRIQQATRAADTHEEVAENIAAATELEIQYYAAL